jgi:Domain of unknown function (DUF4347)
MALTTAKREIAFIDRDVPQLGTLLAGLREDVEAILLSDCEPVAQQMAQAVAERDGLKAVHVIAHGASGEVCFGPKGLALESLEVNARALRKLGKALGAEGALLLWSCDVAQGARGTAFVNGLARLTGLDVLGGRWVLDVACGKAAAAIAVTPLSAQCIASYHAKLRVPRTTDTGCSADGAVAQASTAFASLSRPSTATRAAGSSAWRC